MFNFGPWLLQAFQAQYAFNYFEGQEKDIVQQTYGLSDQCLGALNQTVLCDGATAAKAAAMYADKYTWTWTEISTLCTTRCSGSLAEWVAAVEKNCGNDKVMGPGGYPLAKAVPASWLEGYESVCLQDSALNWCTLRMQQWDKEADGAYDVYCNANIFGPPPECSDDSTFPSTFGDFTRLYRKSQLCSECYVEIQRRRIISAKLPRNDDDDIAQFREQFESMKQFCGLSLPVPAPTHWSNIPNSESRSGSQHEDQDILNLGDGADEDMGEYKFDSAEELSDGSIQPPMETISCHGQLIEPDEGGPRGCFALSDAYNVSTGTIIEVTGDYSCVFDSPICLPLPCEIVQIRKRPTCEELAAELSISLFQLLTWNPSIGGRCDFLGWFQRDYDCFYASVFEAEQPILKTLPLAVQQKQIVVTCNYEARRRGLRKLQLIKEAKQVCPDIVIVLGEDLTKFRDASKDLYLFLRGFVWGERVEKLGFDEIFMDVTDMIAYNADLLNLNDLAHSFFHLDKDDPTVGFAFDATAVYGPTYPENSGRIVPEADAQLYLRLRLASHLAGHLRGQLEDQKGYTATAGISTSKLLAKVVGSVHKPNNQTTLLPPYGSAEDYDSNVLSFLDSREIRAIPGIGSKLSRKLVSYVTTSNQAMAEDKVTVRDVRLFRGMGPSLLEKILGGSGAPRDIGMRFWGLLHGVDNTQVGEARDTPTQISIENSYGHLDNFEAVRKEMLSLSASLIRRMRMDLTESYRDPESSASQGPELREGTKIRWLARPRTLRLSTIPRLTPGTDSTQVRSYSRISHSAPLPHYIFNLDDSIDALAERIVQETAIPMFRKLHRERTGWNLRVLNLAVTNMAEVAGDGKHNSGRDISKMFQRQETEHKYSSSAPISEGQDTFVPPSTQTIASEASWESDGEEENMPCVPCTICGAMIPHFALLAHKLYHSSSSNN
ncbi:hypothetical protein BDW74DRAFT_174881 [Aspergillus multicolor]|uniref:putative DNA polymerase iota n=1 Tax=Aspergillus multicolor TaxID=41759 RepID=UPI003CCD36D5